MTLPSKVARRSQFIAKRKVSLAVGVLLGIIVIDLLCGDIARTHKHSRKLNNINKKGKRSRHSSFYTQRKTIKEI